MVYSMRATPKRNDTGSISLVESTVASASGQFISNLARALAVSSAACWYFSAGGVPLQPETMTARKPARRIFLYMRNSLLWV
jgi:hypothetical protein